GKVSGEAVPVVDHVSTTGAIGVFSVSPSGSMAWRLGAPNSSFQFTWFDRAGKRLSTFGSSGTDQFITLSPDGTRGVARGIRTRFTFNRGVGSYGVWSPDGSRIVFAAGNTVDTIFEKPASGA